ncbi:MAG TPA: phasin family protein [Noviherbaspirillum sp.]|nr:phasin family protein [Noviherbaspirillum sp.]
MQNVFNPMINMYQNQLEASRRFADAVLSGAEKIDQVMIGATRHAVAEQMNLAQAIASARDPRSVGNALQSTFMSRNPEDTVNYQREIVRVFTEVQSEIGRSVQEYIERLGTSAASSTMRMSERTAETAQEQANDAVFNPMTSMFSVWESAFKDVAALAKRNMVNARSSIDDVTTRSMHSAGNYADVASSATAHAGRGAMAMEEDAGTEDKRGTSPTGGKKK